MRGKVVIVTGAANGIGQAASRLFAQHGASVVLVDIEKEAGEESLHDICQAGGSARLVLCDVSNPDAVRAMVESSAEQFGRIDVLFSNAALQITKEAALTTVEEWDRLHSVNLKGAFLCAKHVIPVMQRQGGGAIILCSSGHAFATYPNCSAYASTKGAQVAFMRGLALDYAKDGIRVNCVIPGATDTRLVRGYIESSADPEQARQRLLDSIPMRRLAAPEEIARAVLFLASDDASYITGTSLVVDGGLLAQA